MPPVSAFATVLFVAITVINVGFTILNVHSTLSRLRRMRRRTERHDPASEWDRIVERFFKEHKND